MLLAVGVLLAGVVVGAVVMGLGHPMRGMLLAFAAVPIALIAWVVVD